MTSDVQARATSDAPKGSPAGAPYRSIGTAASINLPIGTETRVSRRVIDEFAYWNRAMFFMISQRANYTKLVKTMLLLSGERYIYIFFPAQVRQNQQGALFAGNSNRVRGKHY